MAKKKEMAGDYEILQSIRLGGVVMVLGYNPNDKDTAYMTSYRETNFLGNLVYTEVINSADYFEVMQIFIARLKDQAAKVKDFRATRNVPIATLNYEDCRQQENGESLEGKLIILRPSSLAAEYRTADCQLGFAIPGDLVFYPDDEHVGIVGGRDEDGNLLIIHCASGYNNVVVTGIEGFSSIARPGYYSE